MTCIALPLTFSMGYLSHEHMRWQPRMCSCCKTENGRHKKDNGSDTEPQSPTPTPPETLNPQFSNFQIARSASSQPPIHLKLQVQDSDFPSPKLRISNVSQRRVCPAQSTISTFPKNAAGGKSLRVDLPPSVRTTAPFGTKQSAQAPCAWGLGASTSSRRHWLAALPPCRCAGSTLFALRAKALQSGAPDFGRVAGESSLRGGLPIRGTFPARRGTGPPRVSRRTS